MDLAYWLERRADFSPDRVAIHFEGIDHTWAMIDRRVRRFALHLAELGVGSGDRVAHISYNSPEFLFLLFACARLSAILVPLNWRLAVPEHVTILKDAEPKLLLHDDAFADHAVQLVAAGLSCGVRAIRDTGGIDAGHATGPARETAFDSPLLIVYTSGTTGRPKGAVLTQGAMTWNAINSTLMHDLTSDDHILTTLPLFHVGGLNIQTLPALHAGARLTLHRRFDAGATLAAIAALRPTLTVLVPAQLSAILDHPDWTHTDLSSLRAITTGSSIVPTSLIERIHARGVPVIQVYGSTETAPIAIYQTTREAFASVGSCGKPALHCSIRVVDALDCDVASGQRGEILVRGPNVMTGYWRDQDATATALRGGWFHTGDIGHVDAQGFYYIDERKNDVIISGGENIYPAEIESVLMTDSRIAEAAVVALPDDKWGEVPVAVVVRRAGPSVGSEELLALFRDRLARFKHPRHVIFVETLPRNALGKILRHELRRLVSGASSRERQG